MSQTQTKNKRIRMNLLRMPTPGRISESMSACQFERVQADLLSIPIGVVYDSLGPNGTAARTKEADLVKSIFEQSSNATVADVISACLTIAISGLTQMGLDSDAAMNERLELSGTQPAEAAA